MELYSAVITAKVAKAFPIIIVNTAIATQYPITPNNLFPSGITPPINEAITSPTPALANTDPNAQKLVK